MYPVSYVQRHFRQGKLRMRLSDFTGTPSRTNNLPRGNLRRMSAVRPISVNASPPISRAATDRALKFEVRDHSAADRAQTVKARAATEKAPAASQPVTYTRTASQVTTSVATKLNISA
jgi:hypothetical protein